MQLIINYNIVLNPKRQEWVLPLWNMLKFHAAAACGYTKLRSPDTGTILRLAPLSMDGAAAVAVVPWWYARNMLIDAAAVGG